MEKDNKVVCSCCENIYSRELKRCPYCKKRSQKKSELLVNRYLNIYNKTTYGDILLQVNKERKARFLSKIEGIFLIVLIMEYVASLVRGVISLGYGLKSDKYFLMELLFVLIACAAYACVRVRKESYSNMFSYLSGEAIYITNKGVHFRDEYSGAFFRYSEIASVHLEYVNEERKSVDIGTLLFKTSAGVITMNNVRDASKCLADYERVSNV